uniref:Uncharacterized protein n=1 Tax=Phaeomonas parva TaxID=124430 RepID=A0A6U4EFJ5_9STRA|mmetsp:Transcript_20341/g.61776  ORF Transcript_20341/g.61776 Transcript_20341/m.61776 type:complete len:273 (+) Transcript_20341:195-1013(+)|eukprot:CAMPEP_0118887590 /NCGR_PEP_ID=MMETSP1163-20130328/25242_1 /TAXON_ID=124430 /ORGANISM="Phaeomonas parva, Strain CCMP2877" /LENGTH=272 /DNA_ID=CAMNT_0006826059 /DNA_START=139 /DNA_END=957 /DNA_ORIENTATION=+
MSAQESKTGEGKMAQAAAKKQEGNEAYAAKDFDRAIALYSEAIALDPGSHVYYSNRAAVHHAKGEYTQAESDARECLRRKPDFVKGYYRLAQAQIEQGQLDEAEKSLKAGLNVDNGNSDLAKQLRLVRAKKASKGRQGGTKAGRGGGGAGPKFDESTAQELTELGEAYQQTQRELSQVQSRQRMTAIDLKKVEITRQQVSMLDENAHILRGIGKMFMRSDKNEIITSLGESKEKGEKHQAELMNKQKYLARRLESQERNLKEIMANAQSADS